MYPLAVTALEKASQITPATWFKIGIGLAAVIVVFILLKRIARMNKVVLAVGGFVAVVILCFSWVYNRSEPKFLTPVVDKIAPFFPSAGSYSAKQQSAPRP